MSFFEQLLALRKPGRASRSFAPRLKQCGRRDAPSSVIVDLTATSSLVLTQGSSEEVGPEGSRSDQGPVIVPAAGEAHEIVSIAIDRLTGEVVDDDPTEIVVEPEPVGEDPEEPSYPIGPLLDTVSWN